MDEGRLRLVRDFVNTYKIDFVAAVVAITNDMAADESRSGDHR